MQAQPSVSPVRDLGEPHRRRGGPTDPSHDELLRRGILETTISRPAAIAMSFSFLLLIYAVPVGQVALEKLGGDDVMELDLFRRAPTRERLKQFQDDLEQASHAKDFVQPRVQAWLTRFGRVGNKLAVVGHRGFLFYRPGISYVGGPGFLSADVQRARERASVEGGDKPVNADPRPAIVAFAKALSDRGIKLLLFPVPDKAMLQPLELHGRGDGREMPVGNNPDWHRFTEEMATAGIAVFDASPATLARDEPPRFLEQDTHWTPRWMQQVAEELAGAVQRMASLPASAPAPVLRAEDQDVERVGDVTDMLKLPEGQTTFSPQRVTVRQIQDEAGEPWQPDPHGDVLLLGDSFTNVFSLEPMGWGVSAGLGPQLARALGRAVDVIAQNDSGAFATRQALARELEAGDDRLVGKKVVIWEFASRELAVGDWKVIDLPAPGGATGR